MRPHRAEKSDSCPAAWPPVGPGLTALLTISCCCLQFTLQRPDTWTPVLCPALTPEGERRGNGGADDRNCWGRPGCTSMAWPQGYCFYSKARWTHTRGCAHRHAHTGTHTEHHALRPSGPSHQAQSVTTANHTSKARGLEQAVKQTRSGLTPPRDVNVMVPSPTPDKSIRDTSLSRAGRAGEALVESSVPISRGKGAEFHCNWSCLFQG